MDEETTQGSSPPTRKRSSKSRAVVKGLSRVLFCGLLHVAKSSSANLPSEEISQITPDPLRSSSTLPATEKHPASILSPIARRPTSRSDIGLLDISFRHTLKVWTPHLKKKNSSLSIMRLPPEIMAEIFSTACFCEIQSSEAPKKRTTPLVLGKICQRWRNIVWHTPHLWSWIFIRLSKNRYLQQCSLLDKWLARVGHYPLTLNLSFENEGEWAKCPPHRIFGSLSNHSEHWRSVNFFLPEGCYHDMKKIKGNLSHLETLILQPLMSDCQRAQSQRKRLELFEIAPKLTVLHLNGYYLDDVIVPWSQLKYLKAQHVYLDECFYSLTRAINLVHCTFSTMLISEASRPFTKSAIILPKLEYLKLSGAKGTDQNTLLSYMTLPALTEFELASFDAYAAFHSIPLMLTRSKCLLRVFSLTDIDLKEDGLLACLRQMPTVEEFKMVLARSSSPFTNKFMHALSSSSFESHQDAVFFLPNLQQLECEGLVSFNGEALKRMILFRRKLDAEDSHDIAIRTDLVSQITSVKISTRSSMDISSDVKELLGKMCIDNSFVLKVESLATGRSLLTA